MEGPPAPTPSPGPSTANKEPVHVLLVGAGAIGCLAASWIHSPDGYSISSGAATRLDGPLSPQPGLADLPAPPSVHVHVVARSNYKAIMERGGRISMRTASFGNYEFVPSSVFPDIASAAAAVRPGKNKRNIDHDETRIREDRNDHGSKPPPVTPPGWDYIFVACKSLPEISDDSALIEPLVRASLEARPDRPPAIVLLQNGVGIEEPHRARFPQCAIVTTVSMSSAEQVEPGIIRHNQWTRFLMGPYGYGFGPGSRPGLDDDRNPTPFPSTTSSSVPPRGPSQMSVLKAGEEAVRHLAQLFITIGQISDVEEYDELWIQVMRWYKVSINIAMNPTSVLSGGLYHPDLAADPEIRTLIHGVCEEISRALPAVLPPCSQIKALASGFPDFLPSTDDLFARLASNTGGRASMLVDWVYHRPLEIEVILGNPLRMAARAGITLPRTQTMYALLRSAQAMRSGAHHGGDAGGGPTSRITSPVTTRTPGGAQESTREPPLGGGWIRSPRRGESATISTIWPDD